MNKLSVISFILVGFFAGCSQTTTSVQGNFEDLPANAKKFPYPTDEGLVRVVVPDINDKVSAEGEYVNGLRHGAWTEYYPSGTVKSVTGYLFGKKQGAQIFLDDRGQLLEKLYFHDNQLHGHYVKFNRNKIKEEREYHNGVLNGIVRIYHDNGQLMEESPYVNGLRDGLAKWYNTEGELIIEYLYKAGEWIKDEDVLPTSSEEGN